jgi:hypothetical protein
MWMKIDDGLHAHRKTRRVTKSHQSKTRDASPMGIWALAGSWSAQNGTDGWVPEDELDRWDDDWRSLAGRLVRAGYWWPHERDGEAGYGFNDWLDYNPESEAASRSGVFGNHVRWHANKGVVDPECEHCPKEPDHPDIGPEDTPESGGDIGGRSGGESGQASGRIALPVPDPTPARPEPDPIASAAAERRDDVEEICEHLANAIEANGSKRPTITTRWRQAARLMLDKDERTQEEVHGAIEWCQRDEFWRANILSLPTLRDKYDQLRLQAQRQGRTSASRTEEWKSMQERQMERAIEREREMGLRP